MFRYWLVVNVDWSTIPNRANVRRKRTEKNETKNKHTGFIQIYSVHERTNRKKTFSHRMWSKWTFFSRSFLAERKKREKNYELYGTHQAKIPTEEERRKKNYLNIKKTQQICFLVFFFGFRCVSTHLKPKMHTESLLISYFSSVYVSVYWLWLFARSSDRSWFVFFGLALARECECVCCVHVVTVVLFHFFSSRWIRV